MRRALHRGLAALCAAGVVASGLTIGTAAPARAAIGDFLAFGQTLEPKIVVGTNTGVFAEGLVGLNVTCLRPGGVDDLFFPATDVYVVRADSVEHGAELNNADGTSPATIIGAGSTGLFMSELLAVTHPQGALGPGVYDVVYDTCQDGHYDTLEDSLFSSVILVEDPAVVRPYNTWIGNMKQRARESAAAWTLTGHAVTALQRVGDGKKPFEYKDALDAGAGESELIAAIKKIHDYGKKGIDYYSDPIGTALGSIPKPQTLQERVLTNALNLAASQGKHYAAIAEDPPDHDYQHSTVLPVVEVPLPDQEFEPFADVQRIGTAAATEGALAEAFLRALERYQGATYADDAAWVLHHARELEDLAVALAVAGDASATALDGWRDNLGDMSEWDRIASEYSEFRADVSTATEDAEVRRTLANLGIDLGAELPAIRDAARTDAWQFGCPTCWTLREVVPGSGDLSINVAEHLTDHAAAQRATSAELRALAERLRTVQAELESQGAVPDLLPVAEAGGPYEADAHALLALDGSGSHAGADRSLVSYAWDLDGDAVFDDAVGPNPTVTVAVDAPGVVGLQVTDDHGDIATSYVPLLIDRGDVPVIGGLPETMVLEAYVGEEFTLAPDLPAGASVEWFTYGSSYSNEPVFRITPVREQVGGYDLQMVVTDAAGRSSRHDWILAVLPQDADGDGWVASATADCADDDALVNPGRTEVVGNGLDDDCNPGTFDLPLSDAPGPVLSWYDDDTVGSQDGLGRTASADLPANEPNPIAALGHTTRHLAAGDRMALAVDRNGALWSWGRNADGQLGNGSSSSSLSPRAVVSPSGSGQLGVNGPAVLSADTNRISVAVLDDGTAMAWGANADGALGTGDAAASSRTPAPVATESGVLTGVTHGVSAGSFAAFLADGRLWVTAGACSTADGPVARSVDLGERATQIAGGEGHVTVILADGSLIGCGAAGPDELDLPEHAVAPARIAAGDGFTLMLDTAGRLWNLPSDGRDGFEVAIPEGTAVSTITAGGDRAALTRADGDLVMFEDGDRQAAAVALPEGTMAHEVVLGTSNELNLIVATRSSAVLAWGQSFGAHYAGWPRPISEPMVTALPPATDLWTEANSGSGLISHDGLVWSWGSRAARGEGAAAEPSLRPTLGPVLGIDGHADTQLRARRFVDLPHRLGQVGGVILDDGQIAFWGSGNPSYFGNGEGRTTSFHPVRVRNVEDTGPLTGAAQATLGTHNGLALLGDGSVVSWGADVCHRPGAPIALTPGLVEGFGTDNRKVAVNAYASFALKRDGSLLSCGSSRAPGTGRPDGDPVTHQEIGVVPGMGPGSVADIVTSFHRVMVLKYDGTIWTWGWDGLSSSSRVWTPTRVELPEGPPVVSMHLDGESSFVIRSDGSVLAWGDNSGGDLGFPEHGGFIETPTLLPMPGDAPVSKIVGGYSGLANRHFMALVGDPLERLEEQRGVGIVASIAGDTVSEGGTAQVEITLNHPAGAPVTVDVSTADGTAAAGTDYVATATRITIPAGETSVSVPIQTIEDETTQTDLDRDLVVSLATPLNWVGIGTDAATVSIEDDDPLPVVSIAAPGPIGEGDAGSQDAEFTVTLDRPSIAEVSVRWQSADGSADSTDYVPGAGTLVFPPGETSATIRVGVNGDTVLEPDESFGVTIANPVASTLGTAEAEAVIVDDEPVLVEVSDETITAAESDETIVFTVHTPLLAPGESVTLPWRVSAPWQEGDPTPVGITGSGEITLTADAPTATAEILVAPSESADPRLFRVDVTDPVSSAARAVIVSPGLGAVVSAPAAQPQPVAVLTGPSEIDEGASVTLSAADSAGVPPLTYAWDVDGDAAFDDGTASTISVSAPRYGELTVRVRVTDSNGGSDTASRAIRIRNVAPVIGSIPDRSLEPGQPLSVTGAFTDPGENTWTASVDVGEGPVPLPLEGKSFTIDISDPRNGPVTVTVCDDGGACGIESFQVTLSDPPAPPVVRIEGPPIVPLGTTATYHAIDAGAAQRLLVTMTADVAYAWDTDADGAFDDGTGPSVDITFSEPGVQRIAVQATNSAGTTIESLDVTVTPADDGPTPPGETGPGEPGASDESVSPPSGSGLPTTGGRVDVSLVTAALLLLGLGITLMLRRRRRRSSAPTSSYPE